jgi:hypothetical protein
MVLGASVLLRNLRCQFIREPARIAAMWKSYAALNMKECRLRGMHIGGAGDWNWRTVARLEIIACHGRTCCPAACDARAEHRLP